MRYGHARALVVVDGDDTLWLTEHLYDAARAACAEAVARAGYDATVWERIQRSIDLERAAVVGLSPSRFPGSCALAARAVAAEAAQESRSRLIREVRDYAAQVFSRVAAPRPGAERLLRHISRTGARIVLCTQGSRAIQEARIRQSGLGQWLDDIVIVQFKTSATYRDIAAPLKVTKRLSIGNSLRSDIAPAVAVGYSGILVDSHAWERERIVQRLAGNPQRARNLKMARREFDAWLLDRKGHTCP